MKKITIISLVLVIVIMYGCKDNSVLPEPVKYEPLIPLSVGNYWLYLRYDLNSDSLSGGIPDLWKFGYIIQNLPLQPSKILDTTNYVMHLCAEDLILVDDSKFEEYGGPKTISQNLNGIYYTGIIRNDTLVRVYNDLIFPYTTGKGKTVTGHVFYYSNTSNYANVPDDVITNYTCISTDSLITTPAGDFRCVVYKMVYTDYPPLFRDEVYYFIKPGIGIVGFIAVDYNYNTKKYRYLSKTLLTDYKVK